MMQAKVAYFSGTGGTKRIAESFRQTLVERGCAVDFERIDAGGTHQDAFDAYDLLILVSVVHEFNFPHPVRSWASTIDKAKCPQAAVFSVSGGGCAIGNRGAPVETIRILERQGIPVVHDEAFAMPSNFFYRVKHPVDAMEMAAYPIMVKQAVDRILSGKARRQRIPWADQVMSRLFRTSWKHAHRFGSAITVSDACTACGVCMRTCPVGNIGSDPEAGRPRFGSGCAFCLGCLYACPASALAPGRDEYALLKDGYDLTEVEQRPFDHAEWGRVEALCTGYLYSGIKPYLVEARTLLFPDEFPTG